MKERIEIIVDDVFNVLLLGLPQEVLFGVVWILYTVRAMLNTHGGALIQPVSRLINLTNG